MLTAHRSALSIFTLRRHITCHQEAGVRTCCCPWVQVQEDSRNYKYQQKQQRAECQHFRVRVGDLGPTIHRSAHRHMMIGPKNGINKPSRKGLSLLYEVCCIGRIQTHVVWTRSLTILRLPRIISSIHRGGSPLQVIMLKRTPSQVAYPPCLTPCIIIRNTSQAVTSL